MRPSRAQVPDRYASRMQLSVRAATATPVATPKPAPSPVPAATPSTLERTHARILRQESGGDPLPQFPASVRRLPGLPGMGSAGMSVLALPKPPSEGSPAGWLDMRVVRGYQGRRTTEGDAWALRMAREGEGAIWKEFARRHRADAGPVQGWLGTALLGAAVAATAAASLKAKQHFGRRRPFLVDPTIQPPVPLPKSASYPSGHASSAYAAARVIGALAPSLAEEAWDVAAQIATSRVYAGVHFPTDVLVGARVGISIADRLLRMRPGSDAHELLRNLDAA